MEPSPTYFTHEFHAELLPPNSEIVSQSSDVVEVRCGIRNYSQINDWVHAFSVKTFTQWIVRSSRPQPTSKLVCQKIFYCHRSAYCKAETDALHKNKRGRSKNAHCTAQLSITIKLSTRWSMMRDPFIKKGLPAKVRVSIRHTHPLKAPSVLKHLSPDDPVRDEFHNYFEMRMSVPAACRYHENKLILERGEDDGTLNEEFCVDNARMNPKKRTVEHWFDVWKKLQWGSNDGSDLKTNLEKATRKCAAHGVTIQYTEEPTFALVLVSAVMARTHECEFSKEIFINSTSCCSRENYSITFLLAATPAGAIPCGVLITKEQSTNAFLTGFTLYRNLLSSLGSSFCNQNYPTVIVTDTCAADAAKTVWPESISLLCISHVLQNVLRWLLDGSHGIPKEDQRNFMSSFQTILYATDESEAEIAFIVALEDGQKYPKWQEYLRSQWSAKEKWCLAYRIGVTCPTEIPVRIFRENIVDRVKGYNLIALLEFLATTLDVFYQRKLREFYTSNRKHDRYLDSVLKRAEGITPVKMDEFSFQVDSQTVPGIVYVVDSRSGLCDCKAGQLGNFCEHFAAVYDAEFNQMPPVTMQCRREIAYVAVGSGVEALPKEFLSDELTVKEEVLICSSPADNEIAEHNSETEPFGSNDVVDVNDDSDSAASGAARFPYLLQLLKKQDAQFGSSEEGISKFIARLEKIRSARQWESFLHSAGKW